MNIAKKYLIPRLEQEYGLTENFSNKESISLTDASLVEIIKSYCGHEAGVRNLRKNIDKVYRKIVAKLELKKTSDEAEQTQEEKEPEEEVASINPIFNPKAAM